MEAALDYGVETVQIDRVDDARKRAQDALRKATGPMHVPQPDGSIVRRCFVGRLTLACAMMADERLVDKRPQIEAAIAEIASEAQSAWDAYKAALSAYLNMGGTEPIVERECRCEVCVMYEPPSVRLVATVAT